MEEERRLEEEYDEKVREERLRREEEEREHGRENRIKERERMKEMRAQRAIERDWKDSSSRVCFNLACCLNSGKHHETSHVKLKLHCEGGNSGFFGEIRWSRPSSFQPICLNLILLI